MWNPVLNSKQTDDVKISYKYDSKFLLHPIYKVAVKDVNGIEMNSKLIKE